jgi:exodeoxyribonuclease VII large subunit
MVVTLLQPAGAGLLQAKFEALKRKLALQGLFDEDRKRPLPEFPRAVGIITSPTGAALRDMLNILARRAPWLRVIVSPVRVQGDGAAAEMIAALAEMNAIAERGIAPVDVIVLARGGGSIEDLWEFNDERLAHAIAASEIPVVSAVGHEIDFTIADFVADLRAPTPSAAAELIAPDSAELTRLLDQRAAFLHRTVANAMESARRQLLSLARSALFREPQQRILQATQQTDLAEQSLQHALQTRLNALRQNLTYAESRLRQHRPDQQLALLRQRLDMLAAKITERATAQRQRLADRLARANTMLRLLSPTQTLQRGYSLTTTASGKLLRKKADVQPGETLITRLPDGDITSLVQEIAPAKKPRKSKRADADETP